MMRLKIRLFDNADTGDSSVFNLRLRIAEEYDARMTTKESVGEELMRKLQEELKQLKEKENENTNN